MPCADPPKRAQRRSECTHYSRARINHAHALEAEQELLRHAAGVGAGRDEEAQHDVVRVDAAGVRDVDRVARDRGGLAALRGEERAGRAGAPRDEGARGGEGDDRRARDGDLPLRVCTTSSPTAHTTALAPPTPCRAAPRRAAPRPAPQDSNWTKRAKRWFTTSALLQNRHGVSVVPPDMYAERLERRIGSAIVDAAGAGASAGLGSAGGAVPGGGSGGGGGGGAR